MDREGRSGTHFSRRRGGGHAICLNLPIRNQRLNARAGQVGRISQRLVEPPSARNFTLNHLRSP